MSAAFPRWAAKFPLTRGVARRQAQAAFDLCAGFVHSQVLLACVRLRVLDALVEGPLPRSELVSRIGVPAPRGELMIRAAIALGLLSARDGDRIGLGMLGASIAANPGIAAMVEHHAMFYADLADPVALLRGEAGPGALARFWPYAESATPAGLEATRTSPYSALMTQSQAMLADDIIDAYPFEKHARVLDVGGGEGAFLAALARRHAHLGLSLFDLPAVTDRAREAFRRQGFSERLIAAGGNFFADPLPTGHDAITLVRIVHDHDDDRLLDLFGNIRRALAPGGALIIAEPMAGARDAARVADVYFAFYLLAMGSGRPRTPAEIEALLRQRGFGRFRRFPTARPMLCSLLVASVA